MDFFHNLNRKPDELFVLFSICVSVNVTFFLLKQEMKMITLLSQAGSVPVVEV